MANYDQSGNPVGGNPQSPQQHGGQGGMQQGGSYGAGQAGTWQAGQGGQQSQYSGGGVQRQGPREAQGTGGNMQQRSTRGMTGGGLMPDLYSGFGGGPFQLISRLSDEMDRIFESFGMGSSWPRSGSQGALQSGRGGGTQGLHTLWAPHIEVGERNGKLLIQADLPGVRKEDVDVQIEQDAVIIQGQRNQESERNEGGVYHSERSYGTFYRMIPLPEGVDVEQANATFRDGVLRIELPAPQQRQRGRRLEIRDGDSGGQAGDTGSTGTSSPSGQQQAEGSSERR